MYRARSQFRRLVNEAKAWGQSPISEVGTPGRARARLVIEEHPEGGQEATLRASREGLRWQVLADLPADKCCVTALARNGRTLVMVAQGNLVLTGL